VGPARTKAIVGVPQWTMSLSTSTDGPDWAAASPDSDADERFRKWHIRTVVARAVSATVTRFITRGIPLRYNRLACSHGSRQGVDPAFQVAYLAGHEVWVSQCVGQQRCACRKPHPPCSGSAPGIVSLGRFGRPPGRVVDDRCGMMSRRVATTGVLLPRMPSALLWDDSSASAARSARMRPAAMATSARSAGAGATPVMRSWVFDLRRATDFWSVQAQRAPARCGWSWPARRSCP
jgi:hypothetical protein